MILTVIDGYKCAVLNLDSILDLILKNYKNLEEFISDYIELCKKDVIRGVRQTRQIYILLLFLSTYMDIKLQRFKVSSSKI
jgi:hypothetical protein